MEAPRGARPRGWGAAVVICFLALISQVCKEILVADHNSRDLRTEALEADSSADVGLNADFSTLPREKDLSPEIRKEVKQVAQQVLALIQ